jgi:hypothetical protein
MNSCIIITPGFELSMAVAAVDILYDTITRYTSAESACSVKPWSDLLLLLLCCCCCCYCSALRSPLCRRWYQNQDTTEALERREGELLAYYRRLLSIPQLYETKLLLVALGLTTTEQQQEFLKSTTSAAAAAAAAAAVL